MVAPEAAELPSELPLAMGVYIGVSFILEWAIKYGGCEVVSLPIIVFRRRYVTYCLPLVVIDATEKQTVDAPPSPRRFIWAGLMVVLLGGLLALIVGLFI